MVKCNYLKEKGDIVMLKVYQNIRNRRLELNMSQQKLAELSGYTHKSAIAHIEKGERDISQSKLEAIAKALNVKPGDLLGDTEADMENEILALLNELNQEDLDTEDVRRVINNFPHLQDKNSGIK